MKGNAAKARHKANTCMHGKKPGKCKACLAITEDYLNTVGHLYGDKKIKLNKP